MPPGPGRGAGHCARALTIAVHLVAIALGLAVGLSNLWSALAS